MNFQVSVPYQEIINSIPRAQKVYRTFQTTFGEISFVYQLRDERGLGINTDIIVKTAEMVEYVVFVINITCSGFNLMKRRYGFDRGNNYGIGPHYINNTDGSQIGIDKLGEKDNFIFDIHLSTSKLEPNYPLVFRNISQYLDPDQEYLNIWRKQIENCEDEKSQLELKIKEIEEKITKEEKEIAEDPEFNKVNYTHSVIDEVNMNFKSKIRSFQESIQQMVQQLNNHNLLNLLKSNETPDLDQLSEAELNEILSKILYFKKEVDEKIEEESICGICYDAPKNMVLIPCGHLYFCGQCTTDFGANHELCPICCQPYTEMKEINYFALKDSRK